MSEHFFTDGLTRCRRRRAWGRTVLGVIALLLLAALAWWLISLVRCSAVISHSVTSRGLLLAMVPWQEGMIAGLLAFFTVVGAWYGVYKVMSHESEARSGRARMPQAAPPPPPPPPGISARAPLVEEDPLALPAMGMTHEDLQRILAAMIVEACEARDMVRKAHADGSVEDYGDRLHGAEKRMHGVIVCLGRLADCVAAQGAPAKPIQVSIKMDTEALQERLRRNQQMIARFVSMLTIRATWVRGYHTPSSSYRPNHGGVCVMIYLVSISTDSLRICDSKEIEAKSSMEALLSALHHETSAYQHLKDLPMARMCMHVWPADSVMMTAPRTLNQEAGNC